MTSDEGGLDGEVVADEGGQQAAAQLVGDVGRGAGGAGPQVAQEVEVLPDRSARAAVVVRARRQPPVQVGHAVAERLDVHLPGAELVVHGPADGGHLHEVGRPLARVELVDLGHARRGDVERRADVVLAVVEPDVAGTEAGDRQRVPSGLDLGQLVAARAVVRSRWHHPTLERPPSGF